MESLFYFLIIGFFVAVGAIVASLWLLVFGSVSLLLAGVRKKASMPWSRRLSVGLTILEGLGLLLFGGGWWALGNWVRQGIQAQQRYDQALCLELSVAEGYKLHVVSFQDGMSQAGLQKRRTAAYLQNRCSCRSLRNAE